MRAWAYLLGGLLLWAVHFFLVYAAASIFLTSATTRVITAIVTLPCLAGAIWLTLTAWRRRGAEADPFGRWTHYLAALSGACGVVAIAWQALPALLI